MDSSIPDGTWAVEGVSGMHGTDHHSTFRVLDTAQSPVTNKGEPKRKASLWAQPQS